MLRQIGLLVGVLVLSACVPKSDLEASKKENDELKAKIATLQSENAEIKSKIESLQGEGEQLKTRVSTLQGEGNQLKAELAKKPPLPISLSLRKALTGPGFVAVFNTTIKEPVPAIATVKSVALGTSKKFELHLNPSIPTELGHLEGATIESGDMIVIENNNYSPAVFTVRGK